jgi:NAD(P)-dependent dehydrogenase (short-subunit alcohol dehydrogenase family)
MQLAGKVILITGSTTGIGEAMARLFTAEGACVMLHGRDATRGKNLQRELGGATRLHLDDIADPLAPGRMVEATLQQFGRLDGVVNNAALTTRTDLAATDAAVFDRMIAVNLRAPLLLVRAAVTALAATRGAVLNIGSVLAHCGQTNLLAYSVSKGGLMTMTRNLADALGPQQVRVNQLNVGWTLTENEYDVKIADGLPPDWPDHLPLASAPSGRLLSPEDIAGCALYWLSDRSRPISGTIADIEQFPVIGRFPNHDVLRHD